jgi:hypothetical protein
MSLANEMKVRIYTKDNIGIFDEKVVFSFTKFPFITGELRLSFISTRQKFIMECFGAVFILVRKFIKIQSIKLVLGNSFYCLLFWGFSILLALIADILNAPQ